MVDQQDLVQARASLQRARAQSQSAQALRSSDRSGMVQRESQARQLQQFESNIREQEDLLRQREGAIDPGRASLINEAIRAGLRGKIGSSDAFKNLSRADREVVRQAVTKIEDSYERQAVDRGISDIQEQLGRSINAQERAGVARAVVAQLRGDVLEAQDRIDILFKKQTDAPKIDRVPVNLNRDFTPSSGGRNLPGSLAYNVYTVGNRSVLDNQTRFLRGDSQTYSNRGISRDNFITPENVRKVLDYPFNLLVRASSSVANPIESFLVRRGILSSNNILFKEVSTEGIGTGIILGPAFASGSFSEGAEAALAPKKVRLKLNQITGELEPVTTSTDDLIVRIQEKALTNPNEVRENFRILIAKNIGDKEKLKTIKSLMESALGQKGKMLYGDLIIQERAVLPTTKVVREVNIIGARPANMPAAGILTGGASSISDYAGTGQYERTNEVAIRSPIIRSSDNILSVDKPQLKISNLLKLDSKIDTILKTNQNQQERTRQDNGSRQISLLINSLRNELRTRQVLTLRTDQQPRLKNPQPRFRPRGSGRPFFPIRPRLSQDEVEDNLVSNIARLKSSYDVYIKKGGKSLKIGEDLPIGRALKRGVVRNIQDLSASFELIKSGTTNKKDIRFDVPSELFYRGKGKNLRFVEKRSMRLDTGQERKDIQFFRKLRGRK